MRPFYTITQQDVGRSFLLVFGRTWMVQDFLGRVMPRDVGKRVYEVTTSGLSILAVENDEQMKTRQKAERAERR